MVAAYHAPFHAALRRALDETVTTFGKALILDLHSFMGPTEHDVCRGESCLPATAAAFKRALRGQGLDVSRNDPYPGGFITRHHGAQPRCEALQVELRYPVYLDCSRIDEAGRPSLDRARVAAAQRRLRPAFEQAIHDCLALTGR